MFDFIKQNPLLCLMLFILVVSPSLFVGVFQVIAVVVAIILVLVIVGVLMLRWKISRLQKEAQRGGAAGATGGSPFEAFFRQQAAQQAAQQAGRSQRSQHSQRSQRGENDVEVVVSQSNKKVSSDVGEYVDFEEVKDDK